MNTCTHTHVPLPSPDPPGEETGDPCGSMWIPPVALSHLYRLVCQREDSGQALGACWDSWGKLRELSVPPSLSPTDGQSWAHEMEAPRLSNFAKGQARERGTRGILCLCLFILWDTDPLLLPSHPQALCLSQIKALFPFSPHSILFIKSLPNVEIQRLELLASGVRRGGLA